MKKKVPPTIRCDGCGEWFLPTSLSQKRHQRSSCRWLSAKKKQKKKPKKIRIVKCDGCGEWFETTDRIRKRHKSKKCRNANAKRIYELAKTPLPKRKCTSCGEWFQPKYKDHKKHYTRECIRIYQNKKRGGDGTSKKIGICVSCGLPMHLNSPTQKVHYPVDSDCFKYYKKIYNNARWATVTGRHNRKDGLVGYEADVNRAFYQNLGGDCKYRECLKCGKEFQSLSRGNRVCHSCSINNKKYKYETNTIQMGGE